MLLIAIPLIVGLHISIKQKLVLVFIFGMGGFVIVASILTKLYCLVPDLISYVYMSWYFREASVAVYVTNIPMIWPLVKEVSRTMGASFSSRNNSNGYGSSSHPGQGRHHIESNSRRRMADRDLEMNSYSGSKTVHTSNGTSRNDSQEHINASSSNPKSFDAHTPLEIQRRVSYAVETSLADDCVGGGEWAFGIEDHGNRETGNTITVMDTAVTRS